MSSGPLDGYLNRRFMSLGPVPVSVLLMVIRRLPHEYIDPLTDSKGSGRGRYVYRVHLLWSLTDLVTL